MTDRPGLERPVDVDEADYQEQLADAVPGPGDDPEASVRSRPDFDAEADPADLAEQATEVDLDDEDDLEP